MNFQSLRRLLHRILVETMSSGVKMVNAFQKVITVIKDKIVQIIPMNYIVQTQVCITFFYEFSMLSSSIEKTPISVIN